MVETSNSIDRWGQDTFGDVSNPLALVKRAQVELDELFEAVVSNNITEAGHEAADVTILLHRLMAILGKDLAKEVDAKMQINRHRKWSAAGDGTGGHIKKDM